MSTHLETFSRFWLAREDAFLEALLADGYITPFPDRVRVNAIAIMGALRTMMAQGDTTALADLGYELGLRRAQAHVPIEEVMTILDRFRLQLWRVIDAYATENPWALPQVEQLEGGIHCLRNGMVRGYGAALRQAEAELVEREHLVANQQRVIQELSTPVVPVLEGVLVLPMIGTLDTRRATTMMETVLDHIVQRQADIVILDMTGIPNVDSDVASHLLRMARAVQFLGAQIVVVGIGANVAQTLVDLDLGMQQVMIRATLQVAIHDILHRQGFTITRPSIELFAQDAV